jgi:drug/metabolite transporter (DMT)-like permease
MLMHVAPLLVAPLAGLTLGEGLPRQVLAGSLVAFGGVLLIGLSTATGHTETWGVVLCVTAAVSFAVGVVTQKPPLGRLPRCTGHLAVAVSRSQRLTTQVSVDAAVHLDRR